MGSMKTARRRTATRRRARLRWPRSLSHGDGGEKGYSGNWKRLSMSTTVLAYLILRCIWRFDAALRGGVQNGARPVQILRDGGRTDIGGLAMIGIGQGLRLLLLILGKA